MAASAVGTLWVLSSTPAQDAANKPNVVFIISDDVGFHDFGFQGSKEIQTPHIDALAKQGVHFSNAYVTAPVCGACAPESSAAVINNATVLTTRPWGTLASPSQNQPSPTP